MPSDSLDPLFEKTERRLNDLSLKAEQRLEKVLADFITGDFNQFKEELRDSITRFSQQIQKENLANLQQYITQQLGDNLASGVINAALGNNSLNLSKSQQSVDAYTFIHAALRNL